MNSKQLQTAEGFTFVKGSNVLSRLIFTQYSLVNQPSAFALLTSFLVTHSDLSMFYISPHVGEAEVAVLHQSVDTVITTKVEDAADLQHTTGTVYIYDEETVISLE